jgi:hypothetical protein
MYWQVASSYGWNHTVLATDNVSVGITVSAFTQNVAQGPIQQK